MTTLAHHCALARIPFDSNRLFDGDDPTYELWLWAVWQRVNETNRAEAAKMKTKSQRKSKSG